MLTDEQDLVIDPFAGSCVTGEACERLNRRWKCCELIEDYLKGAVGRFEQPTQLPLELSVRRRSRAISYKSLIQVRSGMGMKGQVGSEAEGNG